MLTGGYAETGVEVVENRPDERVFSEGRVPGGPKTQQRNADDQIDVEQVQVSPPVLHRHGLPKHIRCRSLLTVSEALPGR